MEFAKWLMDQWNAITAAPEVYVATSIVVWVVATRFTRATLGDEAAAAKERLEHMQQKLSDAGADKDQLISKLQAHGEDLDQIKRDLAQRPPIHVGPEAPKNPRDGDLWLQTSSPTSSAKR